MSNNECAYNVAEGSQEDHRKGAQCSWRNPALLKTNTFLNCACSAKGRSTVTSQISHWRNNSLDVGSSIINTHIKLTDCLFHLFNHREFKKQQKKLHYRDNRLKCFCVFKFERELGDFLPVCVGVANTETGTVFGCGGIFVCPGSEREVFRWTKRHVELRLHTSESRVRRLMISSASKGLYRACSMGPNVHKHE